MKPTLKDAIFAGRKDKYAKIYLLWTREILTNKFIFQIDCDFCNKLEQNRNVFLFSEAMLVRFLLGGIMVFTLDTTRLNEQRIKRT